MSHCQLLCTFLRTIRTDFLRKMVLLISVIFLCLGKANSIHWWLTAWDRVEVTGDRRVRIHAASPILAASASAFQQAPDHIVFRFDKRFIQTTALPKGQLSPVYG